MAWNFEENVLRFEVPVRDPLLVHVLEAVEDLPDVVLDVVHRNWQLCLFSFSQCVLEAAITEFHHCVLNDPLLLVHCVEELDELDNVGSVFKERQDLILTRDDIACFLRALEGDLLIAVDIQRFKDVAECPIANYSYRLVVGYRRLCKICPDLLLTGRFLLKMCLLC